MTENTKHTPTEDMKANVMSKYYAWLIPSPGYEEHKTLFPQSTHLFYIGTHFMGTKLDGRKKMVSGIVGRKRVDEIAGFHVLTREEVEGLLDHQARGWADTIDYLGGSARDDYARVLRGRFMERLHRAPGFLDFTQPCGGLGRECSARYATGG